MNTEETNEPKGFGDTVAKIAETLGLDKIAEKVTEITGKKDCGCKNRQKKLNEMFPYKGTGE